MGLALVGPAESSAPLGHTDCGGFDVERALFPLVITRVFSYFLLQFCLRLGSSIAFEVFEGMFSCTKTR